MRKLRNNLEEIPLLLPAVTMIIITGGQASMFACSLEEKEEMVDFYFDLPGAVRKSAQVLAVWTGKTRSDVFNLTELKLKEMRSEIKEISRSRMPNRTDHL